MKGIGCPVGFSLNWRKLIFECPFNLQIYTNRSMSKSSTAEPIPTPSPAKSSVTASKKTYEGLWRMIFVLVSIVSAFLVSKIYTYQTDRVFDDTRKGDFMNLLIYGIPFAIFYTISDSVVHYMFDGLCEKYFINHAKYTDPEARKKRCYTLVKWGFSVVYYSFASIACFMLMMKTSYFPTWLGGTGSPENIFNDFPQNSEFSFQIEVFYILQFGKHFSRTFVHFFIRPEGNFYEFGLHHTLSISLIMFSYTMDLWLIGSFVLLVHDFTDLTLILGRGYREYRYRSEKVLKVIYVIAFITWITCRIFIFSYAFIYAMIKGINYVLVPKLQGTLDPLYMETVYFPICFMSGMLIVLQGLQLFWTYYIMRSYVALNVSQKLASHNYD